MKTYSMKEINNELYMGNYKLSDLAERYKTPLYIYDEIGINNKIDIQKTNLKIHLFIKKSDDEGKDFYYMGQVEPFDFIQTTIKSKDGEIGRASCRERV